MLKSFASGLKLFVLAALGGSALIAIAMAAFTGVFKILH